MNLCLSVCLTALIISTVTKVSCKTCMKSVTIVNSHSVCSNDVIFEESFDALSPRKWRHDVRIPRQPDFQFVVYDSDPANSYISDGKLVIKPTLMPAGTVKYGKLNLKNCTGNFRIGECGYKAAHYMILPPVKSARLTTSKSFKFIYGKVEITAKLPLGDWLVPEIWLEPKKEVHGARIASGRIRVAMSRGNTDLYTYNYRRDIGCTLLESMAVVDSGNDSKSVRVSRVNEDGWYRAYHTYTVLWSPDNITFSVDGEEPITVLSSKASSSSHAAGLPFTTLSTQTSVSKVTPFHKNFYISLGLSVGGVRDFPNFSINRDHVKPWVDTDIKAMLNFWKSRNSWKATWEDDLALLQIDHIKVTAL